VTARRPRVLAEVRSCHLIALALAGCGGAAPAVEDWPEGTVVAVDDIPILLDQVDLASVWIERIDPVASPHQLRRLALTNVSLPRAIAEAMAEPGAREEARRKALEALEQLRGGTWPDPPGEDGGYGEVDEGNWQLFGIPLWGTATDLARNEWSGPFEEPGRFVVVRVLERRDMPHTAAIVVKLDALVFSYLPDGAMIETAMDDHRMTIVDPDWFEIVPERTQYRMGVHAP
jgi:hypothetical protein